MRIMANFYGATRLEQSFTEGALIILIAECVSARLWIKDLFPQSMYIHTYIRSIGVSGSYTTPTPLHPSQRSVVSWPRCHLPWLRLRSPCTTSAPTAMITH